MWSGGKSLKSGIMNVGKLDEKEALWGQGVRVSKVEH